MKPRRLLGLFAFLIAGLAVLAGSRFLPPDLRDGRVIPFTVFPGESLTQISRNLGELGLVRSPRAFALLARVRGVDAAVHAGPYRAGTDEWPWMILDRLASGAVEDTAFTVPEGLWISEIAEIVGPFVAGGADSFLVAAHSPELARELGAPRDRLEGYLFPSTYRAIPGADPRAVVRQMTRTLDQLWSAEFAQRAAALGWTRSEVLTLASIVEAEARVPEERPRIAAVYRNRLAAGMPLQADPTVIYGLGERRRRVLLDDLESPSPYNTYRIPGLPPGPIGNPGADAIRAVLWPAEGCRDFYFVARGDGTHLFARTYQEHLANRRRARAGS